MEDQNKQGKNYWWGVGLSLFFKLSGWIAGPILVAIVVGRWLDRKFGTEPWLFLGTIGIAFVISIFGIIRDSLKELKKIDAEADKDKK